VNALVDIGIAHFIINVDLLRIGDRNFDVLHTPGLSNDSLCFNCYQDGVVFFGDTLPEGPHALNGFFISEYVKALERIARLWLETINSCHDEPVTTNAGQMMGNTLANVLKETSGETGGMTGEYSLQ